MGNNSRLVYSSDSGRVRDTEERPAKSKKGKRRGAAKATTRQVPNDGVVRVHRETKGRRGKGVCLVTGVPAEQTKAVSKKLKAVCGTGGAVKDGVIELQGDQRDRIKAELEKMGFQVKLAGG
ncbi:MAG: hypothetical protein KC502_10430 [Myxococcales bacterium]|nr:hypothetical protein [Myxococcales bacterium]